MEGSLTYLYYSRLFPVEELYDFLCSECKSQREFSFTLSDGRYIRYLSFSSAKEFRQKLLNCTPVKIDCGAVYETHALRNSRPAQKEFVVDIDLSDYDSVRVCCSGKQVCEKCFVLLKAARTILGDILAQELGVRSSLWVFSGRRGVHCWVFDEELLRLGDYERSCLVAYLKRKTESRRKRYAELLGSVFTTYARESSLKAKLFSEIVTGYTEEEELLSFFERKGIDEETREIVMMHCLYPRLDENVSCQKGHLLKLPYSIHPDTGNVSVPFDGLERLSDVPNLSSISIDGEDNAFYDGLVRFKDTLKELKERSKRK